MRKGDGDMKEKKRVWFTFNLCEADALSNIWRKWHSRAGFRKRWWRCDEIYRAQPENEDMPPFWYRKALPL